MKMQWNQSIFEAQINQGFWNNENTMILIYLLNALGGSDDLTILINFELCKGMEQGVCTIESIKTVTLKIF